MAPFCVLQAKCIVVLGIMVYYPYLSILAMNTCFTYRSRKKENGEIDPVIKASIRADFFGTGLIIFSLATILVLVSRNADFSYTTYETVSGLQRAVSEYNSKLKNAFFYGGIFMGLVGSIMAIFSNPFTQPTTNGIGASKSCPNCGRQNKEIELNGFCGSCGIKV